MATFTKGKSYKYTSTGNNNTRCVTHGQLTEIKSPTYTRTYVNVYARNNAKIKMNYSTGYGPYYWGTYNTSDSSKSMSSQQYYHDSYYISNPRYQMLLCNSNGTTGEFSADTTSYYFDSHQSGTVKTYANVSSSLTIGQCSTQHLIGTFELVINTGTNKSYYVTVIGKDNYGDYNKNSHLGICYNYNFKPLARPNPASLTLSCNSNGEITITPSNITGSVGTTTYTTYDGWKNAVINYYIDTLAFNAGSYTGNMNGSGNTGNASGNTGGNTGGGSESGGTSCGWTINRRVVEEGEETTGIENNENQVYEYGVIGTFYDDVGSGTTF
jgi:hypothetical protein